MRAARLLPGLLAAALCAAAPASAQTALAGGLDGEGGLEQAFGQASGLNFSAFKAQPQAAVPSAYQAAAGALGSPLYSIELAPQLNRIRQTAASFQSGRWRVHVFGDKSQNKKNWFIGFAVDGQPPIFRNGRKMLRYKLGGLVSVANGTVYFWIDGRQYAAYLKGQLSHRMQSRVVIEPMQKGEAKTVFTIQQLSDAAFAAGLPLRIGGVEYRLLYSDNFAEDASGEFGSWTGDRSIVLMYRAADGSYKGYHWFEREIPSDRILVATPRAADSDDGYEAGQLTLGLRLAGGRLEIYYPNAPNIAAGR